MSSTAAEIVKQIPSGLLDSPVSDDHLVEISRELVNWEGLAPFLKVNLAREEEIRRSAPNDYGYQKRKFLQTWKQMSGNDATYRQVITALCCAENVDLAEKVKVLVLQGPQRSKDPPDVLPSVLQTFREHLIDSCKALPHPSREQWPLLGLSHYVELTLHEILSRKEEQVVAEEVKLHQIFASSHKVNRKFVLIEGAPGSGKTTLTWHMLQQWAEGKLFQQFSLLIHISLSDADLAVLNATCLADVIPHGDKDMREKVAIAIAERSGKGVCFLVDAWDEAPPAFSRKNYFHRLLLGDVGKEHFPCCSSIVASRPVASAALLTLATSHVVIHGFNSFSIEEFVDVSLSSDEEKERFSQMLEVKPELVALCHLPLYISIVMHLFKTSNKALPSTQTELYTAFILSKLIRHRSLRMTTDGNSFDEVTDFTDLPEEMVIKFRALCALAYTGVREQSTSFDKKVLSEIGITESTPDTLSLMRDNWQIKPLGIRHTFNFLHYTIQEYMAAHHILSLGPEEQRKAVADLLNDSPLSMTLPFYAGLSKLENKDILNLLVKKAEVPLDQHSVTEALKKAISQPGLDPRRQFLASVDCIYESGKFEEYSHFNLQADGIFFAQDCAIYLEGFFLNYHCLSLGCFLKHAVIKKTLHLTLDRCFITDVSFPLIAIPLCSAEQLSYRLFMTENLITHRALECIRGGLGNIKDLAIGGSSHPGFNPFLALKYLAEGLNRSPCFEHLSLVSNFTSEHKYHLLVLIMSCKSLQMLQFSSCNLSGAIPVLSVALKYRRIVNLTMWNCSLNDEDLCELGKMLYHCRDTLHLILIHDFFKNPFSSEALTQFLEAIRDSRCLLHSLYCNQYHTLNTTQQNIVDDIQYWRTTHQMKQLSIETCDCFYFSPMTQDIVTLPLLPPDIVSGLSFFE